jgi:hypothetical protein
MRLIAEQIRLRVRSIGEAVVGARQILLRDSAYNVRRHEDHQLGLAVDVVAAAEQRAEHRQLRQAGQAVDRLLGLFLNQAGHRHRTARWNFQRGFGAAGLDRWDGQRAARLVERDGVVGRQFRDFRQTRRLMRPSASTTGVKFR